MVYETDLEERLSAAELRFKQVTSLATVAPKPGQKATAQELAPNVQEIIKNQDELGRWIVHQDQFRKQVQGKRWNGEYRIEDRISSALFNKNVEILCEFLEAYKRL